MISLVSLQYRVPRVLDTTKSASVLGKPRLSHNEIAQRPRQVHVKPTVAMVIHGAEKSKYSTRKCLDLNRLICAEQCQSYELGSLIQVLTCRDLALIMCSGNRSSISYE